MDSCTLGKLQRVELDLLISFDAFCKENDIEYFLEGGTALGAIRHQGFIPWDDDVDVGMFRDAFSKLVKLRAKLPEGLSLHLPSEKPEMAPLFAKLCLDNTEFQTRETADACYHQGIFLDIFIYDQLLENSRDRKRQLRNARTWQSVSYLFHSPVISTVGDNLSGKLLSVGAAVAHKILKRIVSPSVINEKFERSASPCGLKTDLYVPLAYTQTPPMPKSTFLPTKRIAFEGHMLPVPNDINQYLENLYGDWQTLPKAENRHVHSPLYVIFPDGTEWRNLDECTRER